MITQLPCNKKASSDHVKKSMHKDASTVKTSSRGFLGNNLFFINNKKNKLVHKKGNGTENNKIQSGIKNFIIFWSLAVPATA